MKNTNGFSFLKDGSSKNVDWPKRARGKSDSLSAPRCFAVATVTNSWVFFPPRRKGHAGTFWSKDKRRRRKESIGDCNDLNDDVWDSITREKHILQQIRNELGFCSSKNEGGERNLETHVDDVVTSERPWASVYSAYECGRAKRIPIIIMLYSLFVILLHKEMRSRWNVIRDIEPPPLGIIPFSFLL